MAYYDDEDDILKDEEDDTDESSDPVEESTNEIPSEEDVAPIIAQIPEPEQSDEQQTEQETDQADLTGEIEAGKTSEEQDIREESNDLLGTIPQHKETFNKTTFADIEEEPPSRLDRYQNFINEYRRLQKQRQGNDLLTGLMTAGAQIGQGMAGKYSGQFTPDLSGVQAVQKMGERPVQDLEQQQVVSSRGLQLQGAMDSHDPKSPQSKLIRDYLSQRLGIELADDVSAADAQMLLKTIGNKTGSGTKYQKVTGTWTNPDTKESKRMSASYDPSMGVYVSASPDHKPLPGFIAEGLSPFQTTNNPNTGEQQIFNKSTGAAPRQVGPNKTPALTAAKTPNEIYASLDPVARKELNDKIVPSFNKSTEKTRQRLTHVPVIMQRLKEAQTNAAALPQLKAELARFDVGDQRLAQQEFNMFGQRMGYKGVNDWLEAHSTGTISPDFAESMGSAITNVSNDLKGELSEEAEKQANLVVNRLPKDAKVDPKLVAPLIYSPYMTKEMHGDKVKVLNLETNVTGLIPKKNLKKALSAKKADGTPKYQEVP